MRSPILLIILTIFLSSANAFADKEPQADKRLFPLKLYEVGLTTGYMSGGLKWENGHDNLSIYPVSLSFGFDINPLLNLEHHRGKFQFVVEPFIGYIKEPEQKSMFGCGLHLKYSYPVLKKFSVFAESGVAPMHFGLATFEQGSPGFNFLDTFGGGIQYFFAEDKALTFKYNYFHLSNLEWGSDRNSGINGDIFRFGISFFH